MSHICEQLIEAAHYLESNCMSKQQLSQLHHFSLKGREVSFKEAYRYFGVSKELSQVNTHYAERLKFVATHHQQGLKDFNTLIQLALSKWPLPASSSTNINLHSIQAYESTAPIHLALPDSTIHSETLGPVGKTMQAENIRFMRSLEQRFQQTTGLPNRAHFKIFYGQVHPAPILTIGINPGGDPLKMNPDGQSQIDGTVASASAGFFENNEHDILDCEWKENTGLRRIPIPYFHGDRSRIRTEVVKTNLAFRRSIRKTDIDIKRATAESAPLLKEIIDRVQPRLILLTGVAIPLFSELHAERVEVIIPPEKDTRVNQIVFAASRVTLRHSKQEVLVVQVAHASQFNWTYEQYDVVQRLHQLQVV